MRSFRRNTYGFVWVNHSVFGGSLFNAKYVRSVHIAIELESLPWQGGQGMRFPVLDLNVVVDFAKVDDFFEKLVHLILLRETQTLLVGSDEVVFEVLRSVRNTFKHRPDSFLI